MKLNIKNTFIKRKNIVLLALLFPIFLYALYNFSYYIKHSIMVNKYKKKYEFLETQFDKYLETDNAVNKIMRTDDNDLKQDIKIIKSIIRTYESTRCRTLLDSFDSFVEYLDYNQQYNELTLKIWSKEYSAYQFQKSILGTYNVNTEPTMIQMEEAAYNSSKALKKAYRYYSACIKD